MWLQMNFCEMLELAALLYVAVHPSPQLHAAALLLSVLRRNCCLVSLLPYGEKSVYAFCKVELAHFFLSHSSHHLSTTQSRLVSAASG